MGLFNKVVDYTKSDPENVQDETTDVTVTFDIGDYEVPFTIAASLKPDVMSEIFKVLSGTSGYIIIQEVDGEESIIGKGFIEKSIITFE